jgi:hypothetical protein
MIIPSTLLVFAVIQSVNAGCDSSCSGHGACMTDDVCACYDNWGMGLSHDSGDCSQRICPYEIAFVDNPDKKGAFHKYSECSGRGVCDTTSGECECFDGFEGKACARTTCPNDCSGHGTCEFIEELAYRAVWNDFTTNGFNEDPASLSYYSWDKSKSRACVCDPQYGDLDCSKRMCPYGNDILDVRDNLLISTKYQTQQLKFVFNYDLPVASDKKTFALQFKSKLNETFTTIPIVFKSDNLPGFTNDIQLALLQLPNRVIDGVTVAASTWGTSGSDYLGSLGAELNVNITFTGNSVQGPQHPLTVLTYECGNGCTPKITGLDLQTRIIFYRSNNTELQLADYNSYECGRRGKCDYTSGLCQCFSGYSGENCNNLVTLL